jgi:cytochrome P450
VHVTPFGFTVLTRYDDVVSVAFTPSVIERLRPRIQQQVLVFASRRSAASIFDIDRFRGDLGEV